MRRIFIISIILLLSCPIGAFALVGLGVGGKVGYANYTGDVLPGSGDLGGAMMFGGVLHFGTLPVLDFEVHGNYAAKDFDYTYSEAGLSVTVPFEFRDMSVIVLAKKNLLNLPASPLNVYVGAGVGWHVLSTEVAKGAAAGTFDLSQADNPIYLLDNAAKMSGHGVLGARVKFPVMPLAIYGETSYGRIFTDEPLSMFQIEGGLLMTF